MTNHRRRHTSSASSGTQWRRSGMHWKHCAAGTIGDTVYYAVEEELDFLELGAPPRLRTA